MSETPAPPPSVIPPTREELIERLYQRFGRGRGHLQSQFLWKKYAYLLVIQGAEGLKRALDIVASLLGLVVLSPVFLVIAVLIKATDGGPILYIAPRVGKHGREFPFPKFRSMVVNADEVKRKLAEQNQHGTQGVTFKMKRDPRITWIGRFIRKASIDELPQLWCVLVGDMSLVGPRPPVPSEVERYTLKQRRRLEITPGLTCFWQVQGRAEIPFEEQVKLDLAYMESRSLVLDLWLLLQTVPAVLFGKGAY